VLLHNKPIFTLPNAAGEPRQFLEGLRHLGFSLLGFRFFAIKLQSPTHYFCLRNMLYLRPVCKPVSFFGLQANDCALHGLTPRVMSISQAYYQSTWRLQTQFNQLNSTRVHSKVVVNPISQRAGQFLQVVSAAKLQPG